VRRFAGTLPNSYFRDDRILVMPEINVGVAVALEQGLIVPVVRQSDEKSLLQIGQEISDLSRRARDEALRPEDVMDGTFTISNLGMLGVDQFTAIINPPQVAILAVGRTTPRFVPDEAGRPALRAMMTVTLSVDHRAVDGGGALPGYIKGILKQPEHSDKIWPREYNLTN
jgi:pyruvate dehydrogenase E2 component (dihydrolipoamide acetyltransferase)